MEKPENRSLNSHTRTQISPTKSLLSTYLTSHSSAIDTNKGTCLPYMLLTCLFLMPQADHALNYSSVVDKSILSKWRLLRFRYQCVLADTWTSIDCGCSSKVDIGALEMFFYNLKSNRIPFANLSISFSV